MSEENDTGLTASTSTAPSATPRMGSGPINLTPLLGAVQCGPNRVVELRAPYRPGHAAELSIHAAERRLTVGMKASECVELGRRLMEVGGAPYDLTDVGNDTNDDDTDRQQPDVAGDRVLGAPIHGELIETRVSLGAGRTLQIALATRGTRPALNVYVTTARPGAVVRRRFLTAVYGCTDKLEGAFHRAGLRLAEALAARPGSQAPAATAPPVAADAADDARRPMGTAGQARRRSTMEDDLRVRPKGTPPESFVAATQGSKVPQ